MSRKTMIYFGFILFCGISFGGCASGGLEIKNGRLISQNPPFSCPLPSEFRLANSFKNPGENSITRAYIYIREKDKKVEEMLIVQIADRTNPAAGPITVPRLRPYGEENMYLKDKVNTGEAEGDYLIQIMAWNPKAPFLQPLGEQGITVPSTLALQGQFQFIYQKEHAVSMRYSKDIHSFGLNLSAQENAWLRDSISGSEKQAYEIFKESFLKMINSIDFGNP
jgi:hypothetical protein